ncbi:hypothetical protein K0M31_012679 [Melipona bicolor]|uniref:Uncharacterized protein n=1 Tax=Melipona bicolor TaxID=60889 RepID=A0AA40FJD8_9HYME|nr:hypothetical protein K0M31_012679 [Melipona bicolor]
MRGTRVPCYGAQETRYFVQARDAGLCRDIGVAEPENSKFPGARCAVRGAQCLLANRHGNGGFRGESVYLRVTGGMGRTPARPGSAFQFVRAACVRACVHACVRACVRACVYANCFLFLLFFSPFSHFLFL